MTVRLIKVLFCDNEHDAGEVTFPSIADVDERMFIEPTTMKRLRSEAKKAGWKHTKDGRDWCEMCAEDI